MLKPKCHIADGVCDHAPTIEVSIPDEAKHQMLLKTVSLLNEAHNTATGFASHLHWPLPYEGTPTLTAIECFDNNGTFTTNILGVLNGILSFKDSFGIQHRIAFSPETNQYATQSYSMD